MTKQLRITTTWKATDIVEVPDDYNPALDYGIASDVWLDQVDHEGAYLVDWEWHGE